MSQRYRSAFVALSAALFAAGAMAAKPAPTTGTRDPDLEPGFPVQAFHSGGGFGAGPSINVTVGDIDQTPDLEIVVSGHASGPLYAWKSNGAALPGWPISISPRVAYAAMGRLTSATGPLDVFAAHAGGALAAIGGNGNVMAGWPRQAQNYVSMPPAMADLDGDGIDEAFVCEQDYTLRRYRGDGTSLVMGLTNQSQACNTPTIADIDGDGAPEVLYTSGPSSMGVYLHANTRQGFDVPGFPVLINGGNTTYSFPVVGDVDGDGKVDIVVVVHEDSDPWRPAVKIFNERGLLKRSILVPGTLYYGAAPALADLDGDGVPEIVFQSNGAVHVYRGDGAPLPGWPVTWETGGTGATPSGLNSAPVVGDVDGDWQPDVVVVGHGLRVYNAKGQLHPRFPKMLAIGDGAVPAIADIELDGRNEIIVTGVHVPEFAGDYDKVWVYDLGGPAHGPVLWGQFNGGPGHRGVSSIQNGQRNSLPVADAGPDQAVLSRQSVTLDGRQSHDPDGRVVRAVWRQLSGPAVALTSGATLVAQFVAPSSKTGAALDLEFELAVTDNVGAVSTDRVLVRVSR